MEGMFERKRRRVNTERRTWATRLVSPPVLRILFLVLVWATRLVEAVYKIIVVFRN